MREIDKQEKDTIEIVCQAEDKKEIKIIATQRKIPGHILWEFNSVTRELKRAVFQKQRLELKYWPKSVEDIVIKDKVLKQENCEYFQVLNVENALKILKRSGYNINNVKIIQ